MTTRRVIGPPQLFNGPLDPEIRRELQEDRTTVAMILRSRFVAWVMWDPERQLWQVHAQICRECRPYCLEVDSDDIEAAVLAIESNLGLPGLL